jgi:hypothetical protein
MIRRIYSSLAFLAFLLPLQGNPAFASDIMMEIFYLPHRPAMAVVTEIEQVAAEFDKVTVRKYSFEDDKNRELVKKYDLTSHMPVAVLINGKDTFTVNGTALRFRNFPKGNTFVPMFAGEWDYADLKSVLTELTREK